jgi:hypothetical protein
MSWAQADYSPLMVAALMIGHHFSIGYAFLSALTPVLESRPGQALRWQCLLFVRHAWCPRRLSCRDSSLN